METTDTTDSEESRRCGAETRDGSPCEKYPAKGATRCRFHGGASTGPKDTDALSERMSGNDYAEGNGGGAPELNTNAQTTGAWSKWRKVYVLQDRARLDTFERGWVLEETVEVMGGYCPRRSRSRGYIPCSGRSVAAKFGGFGVVGYLGERCVRRAGTLTSGGFGFRHGFLGQKAAPRGVPSTFGFCERQKTRGNRPSYHNKVSVMASVIPFKILAKSKWVEPLRLTVMETNTAPMPDADRDDESGQYVETYPPAKPLDAIKAEDGMAGTQEIADAVGCSYETAYKKLREMEDSGNIESKRVANARLWLLIED